MKKAFLVFAIMLAMTMMATFAMADSWTDYKSARETAINCDQEGKTTCAVDAYLKTREAALALKNFDGTDYQGKQVIADWQTNNAAFALYKAFLKTQDYELLEQAKAILEVNPLRGPPAEKAAQLLAVCKDLLKAKQE